MGRPPGCGATRPLFGRQLGRLRARLPPGFDALGIRGWASCLLAETRARGLAAYCLLGMCTGQYK